jgi:hypothetical protein
MKIPGTLVELVLRKYADHILSERYFGFNMKK